MKTEFTITDKTSDRLAFRVGPDVGGYSTSRVSGITQGYVAVGGSTGLERHDVWTFEFVGLPWYFVLTDQEIIERISEQDKGYWIKSLLNACIDIMCQHGQIIWIIQETVKMEAKRSFDKGRTKQAQAIVDALGIPVDVAF